MYVRMYVHKYVLVLKKIIIKKTFFILSLGNRTKKKRLKSKRYFLLKKYKIPSFLFLYAVGRAEAWRQFFYYYFFFYLLVIPKAQNIWIPYYVNIYSFPYNC